MAKYLLLSVAPGERLAPLIVGRPDNNGSSGRDLAKLFGARNSVFRRFSLGAASVRGRVSSRQRRTISTSNISSSTPPASAPSARCGRWKSGSDDQPWVARGVA